MRYSKLAVGAIGALSAILLGGCGSKSASTAKKDSFSWSTGAEISTIDMSKASDTVSFDQLRNTMEGLYRTGKKLSLIHI